MSIEDVTMSLDQFLQLSEAMEVLRSENEKLKETLSESQALVYSTAQRLEDELELANDTRSRFIEWLNWRLGNLDLLIHDISGNSLFDEFNEWNRDNTKAEFTQSKQKP